MREVKPTTQPATHSVVVSTRIHPQLNEKLRAYCKKRGITISHFYNEAIKLQLKVK